MAMFQSLSLRARLSALLGAVLALGLTIGVGLLILHASSRVRAEADSSTRLARELVASALQRLESTPDPSVALRQMLDDVAKLRHVRIYLGSEAPQKSKAVSDGRRAPDWFAALVMPRASEIRVKLDEHGPLNGDLIIASNPADEISEIWDEIVSLTLGGVGLGIVAFVLISLVASRALRPVSALAEGLARLERGDHDVRIALSGPPEFIAIADRINALAATLKQLDDENHRLVQRMIHVQDEERRDIARDLHDEIGPFLFAIRAGIGALARKLSTLAPDAAALESDCRRIDDQLAQLQQVNRRILGRLRPAALEEMGLFGALEALAQSWRDINPEIHIELAARDAGEGVSEDIALTAYRVMQEGLTNVFRHSGASLVEVSVTRRKRDAVEELFVTLRDNGSGIAAKSREGIGLRGMSERVAAQGGSLSLVTLQPSGALLTARLPLPSPQD
jgi:two-component system sensor histidine kinase UhpB